eukprot:snap_masked-scaffold_22-processed-gene-4.20-mRNA-1 protein AED:1.00 eAED:1.00 QI:0/0/0/0/1/1/2/0/116
MYEKNTNYNSQLKETTQSSNSPKHNILEDSIKSLKETRKLVSSFVFSCIFSYIAFFVYPPSHLWFQYIGPGLLGFFWPAICIFVLKEDEKRSNKKTKPTKLTQTEDLTTTKTKHDL